jgi:hypothetical protein
MRNGKISMNHADFKDLQYESYLQKISRVDINATQNTDIVHHFKLQSAYETTSSPIMPYTNYTYVEFFLINRNLILFCLDMILKVSLIMYFFLHN